MCILKALTFCFIVSLTAAAAQSSSAPQLPPGKMHNEAQRACTACHDAHIIVQQRLSKAAWVKEVDKMIKWGAVVDPANHDALIDYFSEAFSTDKPAYAALRSTRKKR